MTPLMYAVSTDTKNALKCTQLLLDAGADATNETPTTKQTALEFASGAVEVGSEHGLVEVVKLLLSHGASVNHEDEQHRTPLMGAVRSNNVAIVATLLKNGAYVASKNSIGKSAHDYAISISKTLTKEVKGLLDRAQGRVVFLSGFLPITQANIDAAATPEHRESLIACADSAMQRSLSRNKLFERRVVRIIDQYLGWT
jgi:Ankyrin repeats (3 copies)/Ankyrin repeat